jgi:hypothetical protein
VYPHSTVVLKITGPENSAAREARLTIPSVTGKGGKKFENSFSLTAAAEQEPADCNFGGRSMEIIMYLEKVPNIVIIQGFVDPDPHWIRTQ